jgi:hypothetical protein
MSSAPDLDRSASFFVKAIVHGGAEEKEAERKVRHRRRPPPQEQPKRRKKCEHGCPSTSNQEDCRPGQTKLISAANLQFLNYLGFHVNKSWVEKNRL